MSSNQVFPDYDQKGDYEGPNSLNRQSGHKKSRSDYCNQNDRDEEMNDIFRIMKNHNKKRQKRSFQKTIHHCIDEMKEEEEFEIEYENYFDDEPQSFWEHPSYKY